MIQNGKPRKYSSSIYGSDSRGFSRWTCLICSLTERWDPAKVFGSIISDLVSVHDNRQRIKVYYRNRQNRYYYCFENRNGSNDIQTHIVKTVRPEGKITEM